MLGVSYCFLKCFDVFLHHITSVKSCKVYKYSVAQTTKQQSQKMSLPVLSAVTLPKTGFSF